MRGEGGNMLAHRSVHGKDRASVLHAAGSRSGETYMGRQAVSEVAKRSM